MGTEETGFEAEGTALDLGYLSLPADVQQEIEGAAQAPGPAPWKPRAAVEAWQLAEDNAVAVADWVSEGLPGTGFRCDQYAAPARIVVTVPDGREMTAALGDWIVRGYLGAFFVVPASDFGGMYEPAGPPGDAQPAVSLERMLREFHATKAIHGGLMPAAPTADIPVQVQNIRQELLDEEIDELAEALIAADVVKIADALADIAYVIAGTAVTHGIPFDAVLAEVHRSNMTKTNTPAEAKLVKGPGYQPPDIAGVLTRPHAGSADLAPASFYMAGVAAERERIRELAAEYRARCHRPGATHATPFADLLREPG